ncbi:MAG: cytidine deaminase [Proteobacteria bacterium]|jgi:cytidine deaminase|nr:cytidine deaminase [Pseudomonadota bacterium]
MRKKNKELQQIKILHKEAVKVLKNAYSPYSKKRVGSSLITEKGHIFSGCNIENASYGGTVCAERVAIFKAVSETAMKQIRHIVVVTEEKKPWTPCGFCRQVIAEFGHPTKTQIHIANREKIVETFSLGELLPEAFQKSDLK